MKEAEVDNYKRNNERLELELYRTKLAYDLVKNNEIRLRDESTHRLQSTGYNLSSSNDYAEDARRAAAKVVNTSQASSIGMTSKLNVKAPTITLADKTEVFLKKLDDYFDTFESLTDREKIKMLSSYWMT